MIGYMAYEVSKSSFILDFILIFWAVFPDLFLKKKHFQAIYVFLYLTIHTRAHTRTHTHSHTHTHTHINRNTLGGQLVVDRIVGYLGDEVIIKEKTKIPKVYSHTWKRTLTHSQKHRKYSCKKSAEAKGCQRQLIHTRHSQTHKHNPIKTIASIKAKKRPKSIINFLKTILKS